MRKNCAPPQRGGVARSARDDRGSNIAMLARRSPSPLVTIFAIGLMRIRSSWCRRGISARPPRSLLHSFQRLRQSPSDFRHSLQNRANHAPPIPAFELRRVVQHQPMCQRRHCHPPHLIEPDIRLPAQQRQPPRNRPNRNRASRRTPIPHEIPHRLRRARAPSDASPPQASK